MAGSELVQSVMRGLTIIEIVARSGDAISLKRLAQQIGVKTPAAHNLARTLLHKGYLDRGATPGTYRLGPAVMELVDVYLSRRLISDAEQEVRRLFQTYPDATVIFSEPSGGQPMARLRISPERPGTVTRPAGRSMSPYGSATGLLFQAFLTTDQRASYRLRFPFMEFAGTLWRDIKQLDVFLDGVRQKGYALIDRADICLIPVAAPVFAPGGELAGIIGLSRPDSGISQDEKDAMVRAVCSATDRLSCRGEGVTENCFQGVSG